MSEYVQGDTSVDHSVWIANDEMDFSVNYVPIHLASIEVGVPVKVLAGLHSGCLELIAKESVKTITDLRGKRVGIYTPRFRRNTCWFRLWLLMSGWIPSKK